ncbi:MAG: hypothetical protein GF350_09320 [Chitinivibrionales bacterium]|nr:hypothetical protein [Chitinivibrionales bacterium]
MKNARFQYRNLLLLIAAMQLAFCAVPPIKKYYLLNYQPINRTKRLNEAAYPYTIRLKELDIEEAYARPQIVYRQSAYQLRYYPYRVWAVKPTRMVTDLIQKHLLAENLVSHVVRRFDEGKVPDYELSGVIEAIEEYDSEEIWFAHLAIWLRLTRLSDGRILYARQFDKRKRVFQNNPENVIKEMSAIMEFIMNQAIHDLDVVLAKEYGIATSPRAGKPATGDSSGAAPDTSSETNE